MIVTFYSYKGGVGRTLALANIACLMSSDTDHPQRVLVWDYDLEAPGLHKLFSPKKPQKYGFVDFAYDYAKTGKISDINDYIYESEINGICVLPASGKIDDSYCNKLQEINWVGFFGSDPKEKGIFFETILDGLNNREEVFDYVLIDSRTGLNDQAGICTEVLSDLLVILFRLSEQNLDGLNHLVPAIRSQLKLRKKEDVAMLPIASQVGLATSQKLVGKYRKDAKEIFQSDLYYIRFDQGLVNNERLLCLKNEMSDLWPTPPIIDDYIRICHEIRKKNDDDSKTQQEKLNKLLKEDDNTTAIQLIKKLLPKRPFLPQAWAALSEVEMPQKKTEREEIVNIVKDIIRKYKNNHYAYNWYATYQLNKATSIDSEELNEAIELFEKALDNASEEEKVTILRKIAKIKSCFGDLEEAVKLLKEAKSILPENNQIGLDLASLYLRRGANYFTLACEELEEIYEGIESKNWTLAYLYAYLGESQKADLCLEKMETETEKNKRDMLYKAYILLLKGNKDEAIKLVPKTIRDTLSLANWAEFYLCSKEYDRALELINKTKSIVKRKHNKTEYINIEMLIKYIKGENEITEKDLIEEWNKEQISSWDFRELIFFRELCLKEKYIPKKKLDIIETLLRYQSFFNVKSSSRHGHPRAFILREGRVIFELQ